MLHSQCTNGGSREHKVVVGLEVYKLTGDILSGADNGINVEHDPSALIGADSDLQSNQR